MVDQEKPSKPRRNRKVLRKIPRSAPLSLLLTHQESIDPPPRGWRRFLPQNLWGWVSNYFKMLFKSRRQFLVYTAPYSSRPGVFSIPDSCKIALVADWGTGTDSAYNVRGAVQFEKPDVTIHLGDVYYSGTSKEYQDYFLGVDDWPRGTISKTKPEEANNTYILNANHEMYSGGEGYFCTALKAVGQETSYFCLENAHWRIVAVDTGYYTRSFPFLELLTTKNIRLHEENLRWLEKVVFADANDRRPVILLSHHDWFSAFDSEYQKVGQQLKPYLDRVLLWFWGHEHRFAGYAPFGFDGVPVRARCIGHGGMPVEIDKPPKRRNRPLVFVDDRPNKRILETEGERIGYCGFATVQLNGPELLVTYLDEIQTKLLEERWLVGAQGLQGSVSLGSDLKPFLPLQALV